MPEAIDYNALSWVRGELAEMLEQARAGMEEYAADRSVPSPLQQCVHQLHEARGPLNMIGLKGAVLLTSEMEEVITDLLQDAIDQPDTALEFLMQGFLQLPDYLASVKSGRQDRPQLLLPLINSLRATRGEQPLEQADMFAPNLSARVPETVFNQRAKPACSDVKAMAKAARVRFQGGLLEWYRNADGESGLKALGEVLEHLRENAASEPVARVWWIASAIAEALLDGALDATVEIKQLFGHLDRQIKRLMDSGEAVFDDVLTDDLVKRLLYQATLVSAPSADITEILGVYGISRFQDVEQADVDEAGSLVASNDEMLEAVAASMRIDLDRIKDLLDQYRESDTADTEILGALSEQLHAVANTLGMIDHEDHAGAVSDHVDVIRKAIDSGNRLEEADCADLAGSLVNVEEAITYITERDAGCAALEQSIEAVTCEAVSIMGAIKENVSAFIQETGDNNLLETVPGLLGQVAGGLKLAGQDRAAAASEQVGSFVAEQLASEGVRPDEATLDALADAICSIEFFVEEISENRTNTGAALDVAESSLVKLGYPSTYTDVATSSGDEREVSQVTGESRDAELPDNMVPDDVLLREMVVEEQPGLTASDSGLPASDNQALPAISAMQVIDQNADEEIVEIFIEEAGEELQKLAAFIPMWTASLDVDEYFTDIRRSFHTLKGSGRMVGALALGECAWRLENVANGIIEGSLQPTTITGEVFTAAVDILQQMLDQVKGDRDTLSIDIDDYVERIAHCCDPDACSDRTQDEDNDNAAEDNVADTKHDTHTFDHEVDADGGLPDVGREAACILAESSKEVDEPADTSGLPDLSSDADPEIVEIFLEEATEEIESIAATIPSWLEQTDNCDMLSDIRRSMHTLKGSGRMAGAMRLGEFAWVMEDMLNRLIEGSITLSAEFQAIASRVPDAFRQLLERVNGVTTGSINIDELETWAAAISRGESVEIDKPDAPEEVSVEALVSASDDSADQFEVPDVNAEEPSLLDIFTAESLDHLQTIELFLEDGYTQRSVTEALYRALHTLSGISESAGIDSVSHLAGLLNEVVDAHYHAGRELSEQAIHLISDCVYEFRSAVARLPDMSFNEVDYAELLDRIAALPSAEQETVDNNATSAEQHADASIDSAGMDGTLEETAADISIDEFDAMDQELYEIFVEEATEIIEASEATLRAWIEEPDSSEYLAEFQRQLHTIKGGARMVDIEAVGDLSHALESLLTRITDGLADTTEGLFVLLQESHDRLSDMVEQVRQRSMPSKAAELEQRIDIACGKQPEIAEPVTEPVHVVEAIDSTASDAPASSGFDEEAGIERASDLRAGVSLDADEISENDTDEVRKVYNTEGLKLPQKVERIQSLRTNSEQVRIQSNVLDDMVNYAGEINIYRSRMEQQVSDYRFNLTELDQTITRLRDQLRQLEIETEAQILYRYEQESENSNQDFDPLEMDRYSNLQQLSRSLIESISDLRSLQELMDDTTRGSETLLLQQSRVSTDLQEGLMRTRMIPFSGLSSRLRRIVRQSARQLGKKVDLELIGADGEMDRTVIDRVVAPLEHMLRNAVAHGIEMPETRKQSGKQSAGTIRITFDREGPEIILKIEDDGAGLNTEAIRERAVERGLMQENATLPDSDIMQFILHTGFSTATEVTQISGRGVGMDVVNSEVKQLGGSLHIESTAGVGTQFTVRLPYTLAINQALLARAGSESFCIPLGSVEGVVRSNTMELFDCYRSEDSIYHYAGNAYQLKHLGTLLGTGGVDLPEAGQQVPVLLIRIGEKRIALQVESLLGSREIVIKPVGAQLSKVDCISGATILGDGSVVMILDMATVARMNVQTFLPETTVSAEQDARMTVMVVDDSITVRKVTSRLLERNGYRVLTAKDGVDAMGQLQDAIPDMMLLDIEMPRMDGFELATHMRNDDRMRHVPIIMITSRTGDKHRERAMQIGVNNYLGKPYQESDLLDSINTIIGVSVPGAVA